LCQAELIPSPELVYAEGNLFAQNSQNIGMQTGNWGEIFQPYMGDCFQVCSGSSSFLNGTDLLASFNRPVSFASVLQIGNDANGDFIQAFNSSDQLVGYCIPPIFAQQPVGNYGCYFVVNSDFFNGPSRASPDEAR
jgi:hypothetical protein